MILLRIILLISESYFDDVFERIPSKSAVELLCGVGTLEDTV